MDELAKRVVAYHDVLIAGGIHGDLLEYLVREWQQGIIDYEREQMIARSGAPDPATLAQKIIEELDARSRR